MREQQISQRLLAIDTSTHMLTVAAIEGTHVLAEVCSSAERNHSLYLTPTIQEVLAKVAWQEQHLDGIVTGRGPGSYTGVRIGVTVAKTLAWVWKKPVVGVSSLEGLALSGWQQQLHGKHNEDVQGAALLDRNGETLPHSSAFESGPIHWIIPLVDARRGQVYTSLWQGQPQRTAIGWEELMADRIRLMTDWVDQIIARIQDTAEQVPTHVWIVGDVEQHRVEAERLQAAAGCEVHIASATMQARWLGWSGTNRLLRGESDDIHRLEPNYTQLAEAEAKLRKEQ